MKISHRVYELLKEVVSLKDVPSVSSEELKTNLGRAPLNVKLQFWTKLYTLYFQSINVDITLPGSDIIDINKQCADLIASMGMRSEISDFNLIFAKNKEIENKIKEEHNKKAQYLPQVAPNIPKPSTDQMSEEEQAIYSEFLDKESELKQLLQNNEIEQKQFNSELSRLKQYYVNLIKTAHAKATAQPKQETDQIESINKTINGLVNDHAKNMRSIKALKETILSTLTPKIADRYVDQDTIFNQENVPDNEKVNHWSHILSLTQDIWKLYLGITKLKHKSDTFWAIESMVHTSAIELDKLKNKYKPYFDSFFNTLNKTPVEAEPAIEKTAVVASAYKEAQTLEGSVFDAHKSVNLELVKKTLFDKISKDITTQINDKLIPLLNENKTTVQSLMHTFSEKITASTGNTISKYQNKFQKLGISNIDAPYKLLFAVIDIKDKPFHEIDQFVILTDSDDIFHGALLFLSIYDLTGGNFIDSESLVNSTEFKSSIWYTSLLEKLNGENTIGEVPNGVIEELRSFIDATQTTTSLGKKVLKPGTNDYYTDAIQRYGDESAFTQALLNDYPFTKETHLKFNEHRKHYKKLLGVKKSVEKENKKAIANGEQPGPDFDMDKRYGEWPYSLHELAALLQREENRIGTILMPILASWFGEIQLMDSIKNTSAYKADLMGSVGLDFEGKLTSKGILFKAIEDYDPEKHGDNLIEYIQRCFDDYRQNKSRNKKTDVAVDVLPQMSTTGTEGKRKKLSQKHVESANRVWVLDLSEDEIKDLFDLLSRLCTVSKPTLLKGMKYKYQKSKKKDKFGKRITDIVGSEEDRTGVQYQLNPMNLEALSRIKGLPELLNKATRSLQETNLKAIAKLIQDATENPEALRKDVRTRSKDDVTSKDKTSIAQLDQKRHKIMELLTLTSQVLQVSNTTEDEFFKDLSEDITHILSQSQSTDKTEVEAFLRDVLTLLFQGQIKAIADLLYSDIAGQKTGSGEAERAVDELFKHKEQGLVRIIAHATAKIKNDLNKPASELTLAEKHQHQLPNRYINVVNAIQERLFAALLGTIRYVTPNEKALIQSAGNTKTWLHPKLNARYANIGNKLQDPAFQGGQRDDTSSDTYQIAMMSLGSAINKYLYGLQNGRRGKDGMPGQHYTNFMERFRNEVDRDIRVELQRAKKKSNFGNSSFGEETLHDYWGTIVQAVSLHNKINAKYTNIYNSSWFLDKELQTETVALIKPKIFQEKKLRVERSLRDTIIALNGIDDTEQNTTKTGELYRKAGESGIIKTLKRKEELQNKKKLLENILLPDSPIKGTKNPNISLLEERTQQSVAKFIKVFPDFIDRMATGGTVSLNMMVGTEDAHQELGEKLGQENAWERDVDLSRNAITIFQNILARPLNPVQSYKHFDANTKHTLNSILSHINKHFNSETPISTEQAVISNAVLLINKDFNKDVSVEYCSILAKKLFAFYYIREVLFNNALYANACNLEGNEGLDFNDYTTKYLNGIYQNIKQLPKMFDKLMKMDKTLEDPSSVKSTTIRELFIPQSLWKYISSEVMLDIIKHISGSSDAQSKDIEKSDTWEPSVESPQAQSAISKFDKSTMSGIGIQNINKKLQEQMSTYIKKKQIEKETVPDVKDFSNAIKRLRNILTVVTDEYIQPEARDVTEEDEEDILPSYIYKVRALNNDDISEMDYYTVEDNMQYILYSLTSIKNYLNTAFTTEEQLQTIAEEYLNKAKNLLIHAFKINDKIGLFPLANLVGISKELITTLYDALIISKPFASNHTAPLGKRPEAIELTPKEIKPEQAPVEASEQEAIKSQIKEIISVFSGYSDLDQAAFDRQKVTIPEIMKDIKGKFAQLTKELLPKLQLIPAKKTTITGLIKQISAMKITDYQQFIQEIGSTAIQPKLQALNKELNSIVASDIQKQIDKLKEAKSYNSYIVRDRLPQFYKKLENITSNLPITESFGAYSLYESAKLKNNIITKQEPDGSYTLYLLPKSLINTELEQNKDIS